jgi:hypothetical protein
MMFSLPWRPLPLSREDCSASFLHAKKGNVKE